MIDGIGSAAAAALDAKAMSGVQKSAPAKKAETATAGDTATQPIAALAAQGVPIDYGKVAAVRAAIAAGMYRIEVEAIARRMVASDLGG